MKLGIIHVDDDRRFCEESERLAQALGLTYWQCNSLVDLRNALEKHKAQIYLLDTHFPGKPNEKSVLLAEQSVACIRSKDPSARICIYAQMDFADLARSLGVEYCRRDGSNMISSIANTL